MTQVMRALPVLSTSEKNMARELDAMQTHLPAFVNQLAQIKEKDKWQTNQVSFESYPFIQMFLKS